MRPATRWPEAHAQRGLIATPHTLASEAGLSVFRQGGNAVDAAVAAAITIAVVYPHMNSIGGDSFWLIYEARNSRLRVLEAAGRSAAAVDADAYRSRYGTMIPTRGGAAALTVPGAVSGWWEAHVASRDRMRSPVPWKALFADAIEHARAGFAVSAGQQRVTAAANALFADGVTDEVKRSLWPIYHPDRLASGRLTQPELAATLEVIATDGAEVFYRGDLGRRVAAGAAAAGSPLTAKDFEDHRAAWVEPLRIRYRNGEVASTPPPTQGFAALGILGVLEGFDLREIDDAEYIHLVVEATKLAFQDRDRSLADPSVVSVPVEGYLDSSRLARQGRSIARYAAPPLGARAAGGDTVAIATADADGNAAVVIQSTYHEFGAAVVAGDTGVLLQNRGASFSLDPTHPNCLAPGKRTAHTLIPSMYLVDGRPRIVYGTMGGDGQPQTQAALVTRMIDRGLSPQLAVEAPRWLYGRTWGDRSTSVRLEARFGEDVATSLRRRGHDVRVVENWSDLMGHAQVIQLDAAGLTGASDPRADGAALGW